MNVLLVYPAPTAESPQKTPPLSILYVGAYCSRRGYNVEYFDERWDRDFADKLTRADVVGVSSMSGYQLRRALDYLRAAHDAGKITVIGGVHPTIAPEQCIAESYIDYVVVGEGERTFLALLDALPSPGLIPGVWSKDGYGGKPATMPGAEIESPIDPGTIEYFRLAAKTDDVMLPASRGCVGKCGFCYNSAKPDGGRWRPIPIEKWAADIDSILAHGIDIRFLQIGDDWLGNRARIIDVGNVLGQRLINWHLSARADQINEVLASQLRDLRCVGVSIGAESGSDEVLKIMSKGITAAQTVNAARILAKHGIKPLYYFILGIPTETRAQMHETMDLADQLYRIHRGNCSIAFFGFDPLMGTALYRLSERMGQSVPRTIEECCDRERNNTPDPLLNAIYYIAGLTFHRTKGDKTDKNFPGLRRLFILPFEWICMLRWHLRWFRWFGLELKSIRYLMTHVGSNRRAV